MVGIWHNKNTANSSQSEGASMTPLRRCRCGGHRSGARPEISSAEICPLCRLANVADRPEYFLGSLSEPAFA